MKKICIIFMFFISLSLHAMTTYLYDEYDGNNHFQSKWTIQEKENITYFQGQEKETIIQIECLPSLKIKKYDYQTPSEKYHFFIQNNVLYAEKKDHRTTKKSYQLHSPWIQQFSFGFKPFVLSKKKSLKFCFIDKKNLTLRTMILKKQKIETLKINGKKYKAQKMVLSLPGTKGLFWKAYFWYDTETGDFLKYKGNSGPKTPTKLTILHSKQES